MNTASDTNAPVLLHWWKGTPNFGDAINPLIVGHVSGRAVQHAGPRASDLFAIGSMLQVVKRKFTEPREDKGPIHIWGTGLLHPVPGRQWIENIAVSVVRGPVTAALLGLDMDRFGDPGLLIDAVVPKAAASGRIGLVPHHRSLDFDDLATLVASDPVYELIDPRDDPVEVCARISACDHVFASSLHGLIVADAYGVPNTWVHPASEGALKYLDYAASVGRRDMRTPIHWRCVPEQPKGTPIDYHEGIDTCRATLRTYFPAALRGAA
ncbi:polysaccharide pyruvyl transferase family protein [Sulfitobacter albidus]|uniref:Polysaccharide pyruvyl transferase family protein n=1 Tax=Sulfitobacter albidus TaxID=2829501 RepID=A0A975PNW8_9RHOB|nr:polysaccharide pyruvyl transferase family protein [Sulfitobacter albidus]QUJ77750.1 polysaccharide pyruvyl transferase family protein [Sulfitobacter albidus]